MAEFKGKNATKRLNSPSEKVAVKEQGGRMRVAHDVWEGASALAANDTIVMGVIPKGAKVVDAWLDVYDAFTGAGTLDIGWSAGAEGLEAADADGFQAALALTAGRTRIAAVSAGFLKEFAEEVSVQITATGVVNADGKIAVTVIYALD